MCEQILKKKTATQYNSNSLNCKNIAGQIIQRNLLTKQKLDLERTMSDLENLF